MRSIVKGASAVALIVLVCWGGVLPSLYAQEEQTQSKIQGDPAASQAQNDQGAAQAQAEQVEQGKAVKNRVFQLGEVEVVAKEEETKNTTVERVYFEEMHLFNRDNVADAVNLLPGVTLNEMGREMNPTSTFEASTSSMFRFSSTASLYTSHTTAIRTWRASRRSTFRKLRYPRGSLPFSTDLTQWAAQST